MDIQRLHIYKGSENIFLKECLRRKKHWPVPNAALIFPAWLHLSIFLVEYQLTNVTSWQHVFVMRSSCVRHPSARCLQPQLHVRLCISPWMIDVHSWNFVLDLFCWVPLSCCPKLAQRISFLKFRSANGLMSKMFLEPCCRSATLVDSCHLSCYELITWLVTNTLSHRSWGLLLSYSAELLIFVTDHVRVNNRPSRNS